MGQMEIEVDVEDMVFYLTVEIDTPEEANT